MRSLAQGPTEYSIVGQKEESDWYFLVEAWEGVSVSLFLFKIWYLNYSRAVSRRKHENKVFVPGRHFAWDKDRVLENGLTFWMARNWLWGSSWYLARGRSTQCSDCTVCFLLVSVRAERFVNSPKLYSVLCVFLCFWEFFWGKGPWILADSAKGLHHVWKIKSQFWKIDL